MAPFPLSEALLAETRLDGRDRPRVHGAEIRALVTGWIEARTWFGTMAAALGDAA